MRFGKPIISFWNFTAIIVTIVLLILLFNFSELQEAGNDVLFVVGVFLLALLFNIKTLHEQWIEMKFYQYLNPFKSKRKNQFTFGGFFRLFLTSFLILFFFNKLDEDINLAQVGLFGAFFIYFLATWVIAGDDYK